MPNKPDSTLTGHVNGSSLLSREYDSEAFKESVRQKARLAVAANSIDVEECYEILQMLGLI